MTHPAHRARSAMSGWPAAALAVASALSLLHCGGKTDSPAAEPRDDRDAVADAATNDSGGLSTDAAVGPDVSNDVEPPPAGGLCMLVSDAAASDATARDAPDDVVLPPHGGIC